MALSHEEHSIMIQAERLGLRDQGRMPSYLPPRYCTPLSILLVPFTLGFSLLFVPILWVVQHEITSQRIAQLRKQLQTQRQAYEQARDEQPIAIGSIPT